MAFAMTALALTACSKPAAEPTTVAETTTAAETAAETTASAEDVVRVGSLKGPTSMGLVYLMDQNEQGKASQAYDFSMVTAADELLPKVISGDIDIALVPANVASVLYNKTNGGVTVIDVNTLGVLDLVSADGNINSITDLKGKTVYMTGKGTTPEYVMNYLIKVSGMDAGDVTLEFKSEPTEVAAVLAEQDDAIGFLPQPFVTAACAQNDKLNIVLKASDVWDEFQEEGGSRLVTGVTVVRNEFLKEHAEAVDTFLIEHDASAEFANSSVDEAAELVAKAGIVEKAPVAKKALPECNITCITDEEMKDAVSGYLQVLFDQNPESVGGKLPADDFYYVGE